MEELSNSEICFLCFSVFVCLCVRELNVTLIFLNAKKKKKKKDEKKGKKRFKKKFPFKKNHDTILKRWKELQIFWVSSFYSSPAHLGYRQ